MQLFYSGAPNNNYTQNDAAQSLGGYISSSFIPNGSLNNIFPAVTKTSLIQNLGDTRLIVIKNTTGAVVNNIKIWTVQGNLSEYKLAAVLPATIDNIKVFEALQSGHSIPFQATLQQYEEEVNAMTITTLEVGGVFGLWIRRDLVSASFSPLDGNISQSIPCSELEELLTDDSGNPFDEGQLFIKWD